MVVGGGGGEKLEPALLVLGILVKGQDYEGRTTGNG